jgi:molybdopterin synthase catalytic subunit
MHVDITLTHAPIPPDDALASPGNPSAGAQLEFLGVVRGDEAGQPIAALEYEAYPAMAVRQMRRILDELAVLHRCLAVTVVHRLGVIPVGEAAIRVRVAATHRDAALALLTAFMDRLKQDVPIWKVRAVPAAAASNPKRGG